MRTLKIEREKWFRPLAVGTGVGILCALAATAGAFSSWSARMTDRFFTRTTPDPAILIVAIDDTSIASIGRWPWDRSVHADLIRKLATAGANVIAYDVNFSEPQDPLNDGDLAEAVSTAHRFALPVELRLRERGDGTIAYDPDRVLRPLPALAEASTALGHTNTPPDADGVVRRLVLQAGADGANPVRAFAYEIAALADHTPDLRGVGDEIIVEFLGPPHATFPTISAKDVLSENADLSVVRNKIVLVGSTAPDLHDEQLVPTSDGTPMPGVEIHATFLNTLLNASWLTPVPAWALALLLVALGAFFGFCIPRMRWRWSLLTAIGVWIVVIITASVAFDRRWILDVFWPTLAIVGSHGAVTLERRVFAERNRRWLKNLLERYVSPSVVGEILRDPGRLTLGGERKTMTVLFSDIRGFTSFSERTAPEELVRYLNAYLGRMTKIVFDHQGVLDKYVGDAVMAFWNAPLDQVDHAERACLAALAMRDALSELNARGAFGAHAFRIGIGVHTGEMVVGNMGSDVHTDYTVIGDSVNLASRLEGLTKLYGTEIIISDTTYEAAKDILFARKLDRVAVKGKSKPVMIYDVLARADRVTKRDRERALAYEEALDLYFNRNFDDAVAFCTELLVTHADDTTIRVLRDHAEFFAANPPPADWDGTWVWTRK